MYFVFFFFFNDTATTEIYTLSLHDALPISYGCRVLGRDAPQLSSRRRSCPTRHNQRYARADVGTVGGHLVLWGDRKSTRLNSSHSQISYAVFCLKKKKHDNRTRPDR